MNEPEATFSHRRIIHITGPVPVCEDCGGESLYDDTDITTFGQGAQHVARIYREECSRGPHEFVIQT